MFSQQQVIEAFGLLWFTEGSRESKRTIQLNHTDTQNICGILSVQVAGLSSTSDGAQQRCFIEMSDQ